MLRFLFLFVFLLEYTECLQCQSGVQFSIKVPGSGPVSSKLSTTTCTGYGTQCLRVEFEATIQGTLTVPYVVGQCVPYGRCSAVTCNEITSRIQQQLTQVSSTINSCNTYCCSTNNCNAPNGGIAPPPVVTPSTTLPMVPGTRRCQSGVQFFINVPGGGPVQSQLTTVDCSGVGNQCLRVDFTASISGITVPYVVGQCVTNGQCSALTCNQITSQIRNQQQLSSGAYTIESCSTYCCSADNCNAKPGSGHIIASSFWMLFFHILAATLFLVLVK